MSRESRRDLFPGAVELMILQTLARRGPLHGYAIAQEIKRQSRDELLVDEGSLYPALQRLLKAKHVDAEWGRSTSGREIRVYELTRPGRQHLETELASFSRLFKAISLVLSPIRP
jgi:transcriptional regulator